MSRVYFVVVLILAGAPVKTLASAPPDAFDGSFRLDTGEVITGGYFVENGQGLYVFMDALGLERGGLFERRGAATLGAVPGMGAEGVEIEFLAGDEGRFDRLVWRQPGAKPARGKRVHPHRSRTVEFESGDGTALKGRLLTPACPGPHPVLVTVHGSGPVDRHGGPFHSYFLQLGMAVLAYDKRGFEFEPDDWDEPDLPDLAADAAAAVRFAAQQQDLDRERIGLFGSSQAGWTAPPAAVEAPQTDFLIIRVGPSQSAFATVLHEIRQELRAEGLAGLDLDYAMGLYRELYTLAMNGAPLTATDALVTPYLDEAWYRTAFGEGPVSLRWSVDWWTRAEVNLAMSPQAALRRFEGPVLWFLAERDENVPLVSTRAALERAFAASPGRDQEIVVIEDAPHSFILDTPEGPRYAEGFFSRMAEWLAVRGFSDPACWRDEVE